MRRTATVVVSVLFSCASPVWVFAQAQSIPADVVTLISRFGTMAGADAELRPGGPPAGFPPDLVPPGAVVNASLVSPTRGTTVVATAAGLSLAQIEQHWDGLTGAGWTPQGPAFRGFVSGPAASMPVRTFCQGNDFVTLAASPREAGGFHLRMTHASDPRRGCVPGGMNAMMADVIVPRLVAPEGSRAIGGASGGSGPGSMTSAARLETTLTSRDVARHYEKQLVAAGWTVAARLQDGPDAAIVRFDVPSKAGPPLTGWLSVSRLGASGDVDVFLRVVRNTRDPRMTPPGGFSTLTPSR